MYHPTIVWSTAASHCSIFNHTSLCACVAVFHISIHIFTLLHHLFTIFNQTITTFFNVTHYLSASHNHAFICINLSPRVTRDNIVCITPWIFRHGVISLRHTIINCVTSSHFKKKRKNSFQICWMGGNDAWIGVSSICRTILRVPKSLPQTQIGKNVKYLMKELFNCCLH